MRLAENSCKACKQDIPCANDIGRIRKERRTSPRQDFDGQTTVRDCAKGRPKQLEEPTAQAKAGHVIQSKATAGPWFTCKPPYHDQVCSQPEYDKARAAGLEDADACGESLIVETAENFANARLIASAPDLLAALKAVVAIADRSTPEFDAARAAIARCEEEKV